MRQTFFHELEELEKQQIAEKKEQARVELYLRKQSRARNIREWTPFFSALAFAFLAGIVVVYALYLFINVSKMGNVADVHLTNVLSLALRTYKGEVYNNEELGIKNWMVFTDEKNGFEIRYPESWKYKENKLHLFEIKKYNSQASINESLSAAGFIDVHENKNELNLEEFAVQDFKINRAGLSKINRNGIDYVQTALLKEESGLLNKIVFWERDGKIYSFRFIFYNQRNGVAENDFEKILEVMDIKK